MITGSWLVADTLWRAILHTSHMIHDSESGVKHCGALLDLLYEMREGEGRERTLLAAKVVGVLALAALDGSD